MTLASLGLASFIPFVFDHFASQSALVGLVVQLHKCMVPFQLAYQFYPSSWFLMSSQRHLGLKGPLWLCVIILFTFVNHFGWGHSPCRCVSKVGGCPSGFWNLILMFCTKTFLFASCFPALSSFQHQLASFELALLQVFEKFLALGSFECPMANLVHY
jgi:hypothetical protein